MKLLERLLARLHARAPAHTPHPAPPLDARIATIIDDALASAGLARADAQGGTIAGVIDEALTRAGLRGPGAAPDLEPEPVPPASVPAAPPLGAGERSGPARGQFLSRSFAGPAGTLPYKLYVPAAHASDAQRLFPLIVMLHGCTQSPDDFATGTRMNELADRHGLLVAYPAQSAHANGSKCWNWFRPQDQVRGMGEPALIAGMTGQIGADNRVDPRRVYVAGLSAGAAMAVVLGRTYPDLYAAVGVHSGLPYRAARDVGSAFAAMKAGAARPSDAGPRVNDTFMPTIVFHGDRDHTVTASNGAAVIAQATGSGTAPPLAAVHDTGTASGGRSYALTRYTDADGRAVVEDWRVHGGGHAWMGGSAQGTYTDPTGPDASAEMVRFFLQHAL